jgi:hypothetical protein
MKLLAFPYFLGCGLGLLILSWFGAEVQSSRMAREFVRFHQLINVEANYFPTARQVRTIVELTGRPAPRVYVIVGGSSVLHGVGQPADLVWTRFLQEELGPDYRVINFAQRAGNAADFGNVAAELLLLQSRPVIFVGDASWNYTIPLQTSFYRHIIFDAWHRGYLLPWPPRDRLLLEAAWRGPQELRTPALGSILDAALNFNDLWNFVGYEFANTNWNWLLNSLSFEPRSSFQDLSPTVEQFASMRYSGDVDHAIRIVRSEAMISPTDPHWDRMIQLTEQMVPPDLRAVTLATVDLASPYYLERLAPTERDAFTAQAYAQMQRLQKLGFNRVVVAAKDFTEDDYVDRVHLSVSGGQKLATILAPTIKQMATDLKYLP